MIKFFSELMEKRLKVDANLQERYRITRFIGKGSYGLVYLAHDQSKDKIVIVKQHRERKGKDSKNVLKNEARILSTLHHPSIPKCLDFFQENQTHYLIMDYIHGHNFEDLVLNEGKIYDEKKSLEILSKVLNIVLDLHENNIIHHDLRLPNIIEKGNEIFIIDFGLATRCNEQVKNVSKSSSDQKSLFREKSCRSDFYALGHFLLFLLYSNFEATSKKELSWEEELDISHYTKKLIKKLLRIQSGYEDVYAIIEDVKRILTTLK